MRTQVYGSRQATTLTASVSNLKSMEAFRDKVLDAICDLVELNGDDWPPEIPVHIMAEQLSRVQNPCL